MVHVQAYIAPISSNPEQIKELETRIQNLEAEIAQLTTELTTAELSIKAKDSTILEKEGIIQEKLAQIDDLQIQINGLLAIKKDLEDNIDQLATNIEHLEAEVDTLNSLVEDYITQVEQLNNTITEKNAKIAELEEQLAAGGASSEDLAQAHAEIERLQGLNTQLTTDNDILTSRNAQLELYNQELEQQVETITEEKTQLEAENEQLTDQITQLQEQLSNAPDPADSMTNVFSKLVYNSIGSLVGWKQYPNVANYSNAQFSGTGYVLSVAYQMLGQKSTYELLSYKYDSIDRPQQNRTYNTAEAQTIHTLYMEANSFTIILNLIKLTNANNVILQCDCPGTAERFGTGVGFVVSDTITVRRY